MTIHLDYRAKDELSSSELKVLNKLHLKNGIMWPRFKRDEECEIILAINKGQIIGWGLVFTDEDNNEPQFHVFVKTQYRRMGVGTAIFELASQIHPDGLWTISWNKSSSSFYKIFNVLEVDKD